ncbi:hypothetical protein JCM31271_28790 [Halorubrum trueperi]
MECEFIGDGAGRSLGTYRHSTNSVYKTLLENFQTGGLDRTQIVYVLGGPKLYGSDRRSISERFNTGVADYEL